MADAASLDCDVAVVGAGLAGLTAASELGARGLDVRVLEARDRVGGRSLNHRVGAAPDQVVELGGQWVGPGQREVLALAAELGLETFPTHTAGENVLEDHRGRVSRYRGTIPRLNPVALADISQAEARLGRLIRRVSAAAPWTAHGAERLDSQTFATWIRRTARTRLARETLALACRAVFAAEPEELSLLHVLFYSASADGWDSLLDTRGGAQQDRIVGGSQLLATRLAERLDGRIELGRPVRSIHSLDDGVLVEGLAARRAIVAVPPRSRAESSTTHRFRATATSSPSGSAWARSSSAWRSTTGRSGAPTGSAAKASASAARSR